MLGGNRVGGNWSTISGNWSAIGGNWGTISSNWGSVGGLGDHWGSDNSWDSSDHTVDRGGGWGLEWVNTGLVGGNGSTEAKSIGNVVHSSDSAIGITETVRTDLHTWTALFLSESAASGVVFVVAKGVVAKALEVEEKFQ